jgi:hypothetical protein
MAALVYGAEHLPALQTIAPAPAQSSTGQGLPIPFTLGLQSMVYCDWRRVTVVWLSGILGQPKRQMQSFGARISWSISPHAQSLSTAQASYGPEPLLLELPTEELPLPEAVPPDWLTVTLPPQATMMSAVAAEIALRRER